MGNSYHNPKGIKVWMIRSGVRERDIVKGTGLSQQYVNQTINGHRKSKDVLAWLKGRGCPVKHLGMKD